MNSPDTSPASNTQPKAGPQPSENRPQPPEARTLPPNHAARASFVGGRWVSLRAALHGAGHTLRTQPNAWIELAALAVVAALGLWLGIAPFEWALLGLTGALVLALEAMNTAIEAVVDLVSPEWHPLARTAKDAAAGAMIFVVLGSLLVAVFIFGPRLLALLPSA